MSETEHLRAGAYDAKVSTTHATDSSGEAPPSRDSRIVVAVALLLGSVILLWILPAFGVIAAFGCGMLLGAWVSARSSPPLSEPASSRCSSW